MPIVTQAISAMHGKFLPAAENGLKDEMIGATIKFSKMSIQIPSSPLFRITKKIFVPIFRISPISYDKSGMA
uniref:Uncharacterized protein n=1 Tax=Romanomermis culicivorax TaxID=13658 RepID=A0A915KBB1_ROMCU